MEDNTQIRIQHRRAFFKKAGALGATLVGVESLVRCSSARAVDGQPAVGTAAAEPMSPNEDLLQEHALLSRLLLIYEESIRRIEARVALDPEVLKRAAQIVRDFIENYHEKDEEQFIFPRFERAGKLVGLVKTLRIQHAAGRPITDYIIAHSTLAAFRNPIESQRLVDWMRVFMRMYYPHAAREGSVLFPAFRDLVSPQEFNEIGDLFERREHEILGREGFEGQVKIVAGLEQQLGIEDLNQFTPKPM